MKKLIILAGALFLSLTCFAVQNKDCISRMSVQGSGKVEVPADQFEMSIGVKVIDKSAENGMEINSEKMGKVKEVLTEVGINKKEYKTSGFSVKPVFSRRPKNAPGNWKREIVGYQVDNGFNVKSKKMDAIGHLIQKAVAAGANNISNITFSLSNPYKYRAEAIETAVKNAEKDADALLKATGQETVKILDISISNFYVPSRRYSNAMFTMEKADAADSVPVNPGTINVNVKVNIDFQIRKKNC
ncbi:MAG: SIMPL domain-containing protein [Victivallales bacterium]|nr:SIMPL domain-containing protein [Victivallales bacterium]